MLWHTIKIAHYDVFGAYADTTIQYGPRVIVTDKLRSYGVARRQLFPKVEHRQSRYLNNALRTHTDRPHVENGRCNDSNRAGRLRTSFTLTHLFMVTFIPADTF